jgi:hypothetical protein
MAVATVRRGVSWLLARFLKNSALALPS